VKFIVGQRVWVRFADHCEDGDEPIMFDVYGRVAKVARKYIVVCAWGYTDRTRDMDDDSNIKRFTIVRSTMIQAVRLEVAE
jgi:hypothetical protein